MLRSTQESGRRVTLLAIVTALCLVALPVAGASALSSGSSQTWLTGTALALGTSLNDSVTITANVNINGSVQGNQYVNFYDTYNGTSTPAPGCVTDGTCVFLGKAKLFSSTQGGANQTACATNGGANKTVCVATFTLSGTNSAFRSGLNRIDGNYPGDNFIGSSDGFLNLYSGTDNLCKPGGKTTHCQATQTSSDGTASASFTSSLPGSGSEDVVLAFGPAAGAISGCSSETSGSLVAYNLINSGGNNQLTYTVLGPNATTLYNAYGLIAPGHTCFESSAPFTDVNGVQTPQETDVNGNPLALYEGLLPACTAVGSVPPCVVSISYVAQKGPHPAQYAEVVLSNSNDPRLAH